MGTIMLKYKSVGAVDFTETIQKSRHISGTSLCDSSPHLVKM